MTALLRCSLALVPLLVSAPGLWAQERVFLSELDLGKVQQGWGRAQADRSVGGQPLRIAGRSFTRGVGTHAASALWVRLDGRGQRFVARIGVDDEVAPAVGTVNFKVLTDDGTIYESGVMKTGTPARKIDLDVRDSSVLILLVEDGSDGINYDHADWADAEITYTGAPPTAVAAPREEPYILTPPESPRPRINGARVFGVRPGRPVLYTVAATGRPPLRFRATDLPAGLSFDAETGRLSGCVEQAGSYPIGLEVANALGRARATLRLEVGEDIALTPPMGWNSWNCWGCAVDAEKVIEAAQAMVDSGLSRHGWTYINIDDCWMRHPEKDDPILGGPVRDDQGMLRPNGKFPDLAGMIRRIHGLGLKVGVYISPGPTTCQGYVGSYGFEQQDAAQFAAWGFDYLKYDWCGYSQVESQRDRPALIKPYRLMADCLRRVDRDIVYSLCQYGMGQVWEWGAEAGGQCWRTTGDIVDSWGSVSGIGFGQEAMTPFGGPGHWNDPDMLVVGRVGWGPNLHDSRLTPTEQYTHISLWCLLNAPLLLGCDLTQLDPFTRNLLTNDEVLGVNQDPLGGPARRVQRQGGHEVWAKPLADGALAVALFNRGERPESVRVSWTALGLQTAPRQVRDLWRQRDLTPGPKELAAEVGRHGVFLVRVVPGEAP